MGSVVEWWTQSLVWVFLSLAIPAPPRVCQTQMPPADTKGALNHPRVALIGPRPLWPWPGKNLLCDGFGLPKGVKNRHAIQSSHRSGGSIAVARLCVMLRGYLARRVPRPPRTPMSHPSTLTPQMLAAPFVRRGLGKTQSLSWINARNVSWLTEHVWHCLCSVGLETRRMKWKGIWRSHLSVAMRKQ